jgi:hypothetical protein
MPHTMELHTGEAQTRWRISFSGEDKGPPSRFPAQIDLGGGGGGVRCAAANNRCEVWCVGCLQVAAMEGRPQR